MKRAAQVQLSLACILIAAISIATARSGQIGTLAIAVLAGVVWAVLFGWPTVVGAYEVRLLRDTLLVSHLFGNHSAVAWDDVVQLRTKKNVVLGARARLVGVVSRGGRSVVWLSDRIVGFDELVLEIRQRAPNLRASA